MLAEEQQRLLAAHRAAHRVHAMEVDVQPRQRVVEDLRHAGEVVDLALRAPGEAAAQVCALAVGVDDCEAADRREVAQSFAFVLPQPPRPCGEMTRAIVGLFCGVYQLGRSTTAWLVRPSWAR